MWGTSEIMTIPASLCSDAAPHQTESVPHFTGIRKDFSDPRVIILEDRVIGGEERLHAIGYVEHVLLVVHTFREEGLGAINECGNSN